MTAEAAEEAGLGFKEDATAAPSESPADPAAAPEAPETAEAAEAETSAEATEPAKSVFLAGRKFSARAELAEHVKKIQESVASDDGSKGDLSVEDNLFIFHLLLHHPKAVEKMIKPISHFRYGIYDKFKNKCFISVAADGSQEGVSAAKSIDVIFPKTGTAATGSGSAGLVAEPPEKKEKGQKRQREEKPPPEPRAFEPHEMVRGCVVDVQGLPAKVHYHRLKELLSGCGKVRFLQLLNVPKSKEPPQKKAKTEDAVAGEMLAYKLDREQQEGRDEEEVRQHASAKACKKNAGLPFSLQTLGDAHFVTVSVGRGYQVFECDKLRLAYIGPRFNEKVRALITVGETIITALKQDIVVWHKLTEIGRLKGHRHSPNILCAIGSGFLISAAGIEVIIWQLSDVGRETGETAETEAAGGLRPLARPSLGPEFGEVTAVCHPPTYLHKVLIAGSAGGIQLWNVRTNACVHAFRAHLRDGAAGGASAAPVTRLAEAPNALDVVAVGFATGRICLMNIRKDTVLFELQQAQGRITALAFRADDVSMPYLVSGTPTGDFVVWDLEKRRMHHVREGAHRGPVSEAIFLPKEPIMLTSGGDNAVKMWIFDTADGLSRYLKGRCGCPGPARRLQFYGEGDKELLVGGDFKGQGYLSKISFIQDHQNQEYSQAALKKMSARFTERSGQWLPPVVDIASCQVRHYDWPCVVTAHQGLHSAMVWSPAHRALSPTVLAVPEETNGNSPVSSVAISSCGNYCVLGLENGSLHRFNLQSGMHRGNIPKAEEGKEDPDSFGVKVVKRSSLEAAPPPPPRAHNGRVCGLAITTSAKVISSASHPKDCCLKLWKLSTHEALGEIPLNKGRPGRPSCLMLKPFGVLIAACLDDGALPIVDLNSEAVVRAFDCGVPATDLAFTPDGRWLAASLCDGGLRIFDLPAARCIDSFVFAQPALGLCFSPSGAFLLTTHAKNNAIQVWANKFLFDPSLSAPLLRPEPEAPISIDEPGAPDEEEEEAEEVPDAEKPKPEVTTTPLESSLLTLSDVPPAKVLATLHLDLVKERNKPTQPAKPLPNAPFFLPTAHEGVTPRFAPLGEEEGEGTGEVSGGRPSLFEQLTADEKAAESETSAPFQLLLRKGRYDKALEHLKAQTPSGVHLAIEQLGPSASGDELELEQGLKFFLHHMAQTHFADEVQAYLSLFLAAHGEEISASKELRTMCAELGAAQEEEAEECPVTARCRFDDPEGAAEAMKALAGSEVQGSKVEMALLEGEAEDAYWEETNRRLKEAFDNPKGKGKKGKGKGKGKGKKGGKHKGDD
ncbi:unnamed protein product [Effrenium voratum]|nr:unnamed protein product [Effrenium voratum]